MDDPRLLDCSSKPELEANFSRLLAIIDAQADRITALDHLAVVYDANGGTGSMAAVDPLPVGATLTVLANGFTPPEGMEFNSWNSAADGNGDAYDPENEITVTAAMRGTTLHLYAIWTVPEP